jgi:hypothetical protein
MVKRVAKSQLTEVDPRKVLFVRIHWMKRYEGSSKQDRPYAGAQSRDGGSEDWNFYDYYGHVFGGFWPGRIKKSSDVPMSINLSRLAARGERVAKHVFVVFLAPRKGFEGLHLVGWYDDASVYRELQKHADDGQWYNVTTLTENAHLIRKLKDRPQFSFSNWRRGAYRFGDQNSGRPYSDVLKFIARKRRAVA